MNDRLRAAREELHLSRIAFGERLGLSGDIINSLERGRVPIKESTLILLENVYGISSEWLKTGNGQMFLQNDNSILDELREEYSLEPEDVKIVERYMALPASVRKEFRDFLRELADVLNEREEYEQRELTGEEAYEKNVLNARSTDSSASNTTGSIRSPDANEA